MRAIRFFLIAIVVLFNGFSGEAQFCSGNQLPLNLQNGLVAYYPFCGNANDGSGNGNNGIVNGAVPSIDRFGNLNSAYYFNGNGNRITVPNSNSLNPSSITINAWIKGEGTANYRYILQKQTTDNTPTQFSYSLLIRENEPGVNPLSFQSHFGIGDCNNISGVAAAGNANKFITGVWQMVTSTIASDGTCTIYVDGKKDTVVKLTPYQPCNTPNSELRIGSAWDGVPAWFRGDMDDISIFSRVLSACEVNQLYHLPNTTATATGFDPLPDVQKVCADSIQLNAGQGFAAYRWNTGDTTPSITVSFGGRYKVSVIDTAGCTAYDSTLVHLQRVDILQSDTSICVGDSLVLSVGEGINDPVLFDFNSCIFADFVNTGGGGAASATVNGNQSCGLNLEWPAVAESNRKNFSYGSYEIDMRASTNIANQNFTVLGVNIDSRPAGTDDVGYGIYVNGVLVKVSATHPAQYPNWYKLRVNITPDSLIVWIDNTQLYAGMHADFGPAPFSPISIGTYSSSFYDNVRYTPYGINQSIRWSTGDTTRSIVIRPLSTTVYTVSVSENALTCMDSVRVTVKGRFGWNPLPDTIRSCTKSIILDAGTGFANYNWSNGQSTPQIAADSTGFYRVYVTDSFGCQYGDTSLVSLLIADIVQSDTSICKNSPVTLSIDSLFPGMLQSQPPLIPPSLYNFLQAYYPFSGNTNDCSKNNYTGYGTNVALTTDRFGNPNSAYQFNGTNSRIYIPYVFFNNGWQDYTISLWFSPDSHTGTTGPGQTLIGTFPQYGFTAGYSYNGSRRVYHSKSSNLVNPGWDILNADPFNAGPMELGKWYHLIIVKRGLTYEYFLNGRLDKRVITTTVPAVEDCSLQLGAMMPDNSDVFNGKIDEVIVFKQALDSAQLQQLDVFTPRVQWSTGDTTKSITVIPDRTAIYTVTVSNGISSCTDSVRISVGDSSIFDPLPKNISACGDSIELDAGPGFASYIWNNGDSIRTTSITRSGTYKVQVGNPGGCFFSDSVFVSLLKAKILQKDTVICRGSSIILEVDASYNTGISCSVEKLPSALRNGLVAYYPVCGNANDVTGNGNNGIVNGATLITDRYGSGGGAYYFDGISNYIQTVSVSQPFINKTYSAWVKLSTLTQRGGGLVGIQSADGQIFDAIVYNETDNGWGFGSDNYTRSSWSGYKESVSEWVMITATYEQNSYKLYRNGELIGTTSAYGITNFLNSAKINIGYRHDGGGSPYLNAAIDDIFVYGRVLNMDEVKLLYNSTAVVWSTGATDKLITVSPDKKTTYYVTVSEGVMHCMDSVTVDVIDIGQFDPFKDTLLSCGESFSLEAGAGFFSYQWNTGDTSPVITAAVSGKYSVEVSNQQGCKSTDSVMVSIINANILNSDTLICKGSSVVLLLDSMSRSFNGLSCISSDLPTEFLNGLVAYYPFCGNANDAIGTNNGVVYNAQLATNRNGVANTAYSFNGINAAILPSNTNTTLVNSFTYAFWARPLITTIVPQESQTGNAASNMFTNPCVIHPIHGMTFGGDMNSVAGSGVYVGTNGLYVEEHSNGWEAVPLSYTADLTGWHQYIIVYENKVPSLYIDGQYVKSGIPSVRNIYASLGKDAYPAYTLSGIGAGYSPPMNSTAQFFRGDIDDVLFYNRSLNPIEVKRLFSDRVSWSTGETADRIVVRPQKTTTYYVTVSNGISSCIDSVRITVDSMKGFNPLPDTLCVCADSILLDAGPGFHTYEWSTGDTTQAITVRRKGWHKVSVTNESGCRAEDSVYIRRVFADILQNDTALKALTPFELSIDTSYWSENGYRVYWSTGDSTTSINVAPRQKTKYYVYVTDGFFICKDSITINVKCISGYNPCKSKVAVCDRSVVLDAGAGYTSYYWSTGDTTQQVTITSNGNYYVYVFDSTGAFGEDSAYVNLLAFAIQPRDTSVCKGNTVQLVAGNLFNGNDLIKPTLAWSNGEQDTSIIVAPLKTTKYYATLTNTSNACRDSVIVNVVNVDTSLTIIGDSTLCDIADDSIRLQAGRGRAYQWLNNGIPIIGANSREYVTRQAGNYAVIVTDTLGCQDTSRVQRVELNPLPTGTFLPPAKTTFCEGDSIFIAATGANGYQWYRNGILIPGATAAQFKVSQSGTYSVMYVSDKGCLSPGDTIQLQTSKKPDASFVFTTYCAGIASEFTSTSDTAGAGDIQYQWKFADGSTAGVPNVSHVFARSGNYPVQLILTSFDCANFSDTATVVVRVQQPTPGIRYATINASVNVPVTLVARPLGSNYLWVPPDGLDNPRVRTPRLTPQADVIYIINISNTSGCVTYDTLPVQVFDGRDIYVARGFTPNNDGKNDRLYPIAVGIVEIRYFRIYNRWGNLVFASSSLLPQDGWDGIYNGKAQPSDTYTWMVEGVDIEGKVIRKSGSSVLIR